MNTKNNNNNVSVSPPLRGDLGGLGAFFWSIPSNQNEIITNTPLGVKSIQSLFFENKNGKMFSFGDVVDCISISIDNKQICRDMMMLPFCTESPDRRHRFDWQNVCLKLGLNVNNSEVKISGLRDNDLNIVFVCDTAEIQQENGFIFIENKILRLRCPEDDSDYTPVWRPKPRLQPTRVEHDKAVVLGYDYKPLGVFAYPFYTIENGRVFNFKTDNKITFDISADSVIMPEDMEMFMISANQKITWKDCFLQFEGETARNLEVNMQFSEELQNQLATGTLIIENEKVKTIDIAMSFFYKKI